jgi:hypothetical protein
MGDTRTHVRLASAKLGDDTTFSRYVKVKGHGKTHGKPRNIRLPGFEAAGVREGRTFFKRSVKPPSAMRQLLVSGHSNVKIGRDVRVGRLKGYWLYTLTFEERKTCPRACVHWQTCYGNSMPYAKRIDHTAPDLLPRLEAEIGQLLKQAARRPGAPGIIVRLHAIGDFYSPSYVAFWDRMLREHPKLVIFGYTAWLSGTPIGYAVNELINAWPGRAMIRFSNGGMRDRSTVPIVNAEDCPPGAFVCPEQTGQFDACGKCGACWSTLKNVAFMEH